MATAPMRAIRTISGNQPLIRRLPQHALESFLAGTPVMAQTGLIVVAWNGTSYQTGVILGIAQYDANPSITVDGTPAQQSFGSVPNEASAVNLSRPFFDQDGNVSIELGVPDSVFYGQVGPTHVNTDATLGVAYGMTKDSDNHWYVDTTKTTSSAVCTVIKRDPNDNRGVHFTFLAASVVAGLA